MLHSTSLLSCSLHLKWNESSFFKWKAIVTPPALSLSKLFLLFYSLQLTFLKYWLLSPCQSDDSWSQKLKPGYWNHMISLSQYWGITYTYPVTIGDSKQECPDLNATLNSCLLGFIITIPDKCNYAQIMVPGLPEVCSLPFPSHEEFWGQHEKHTPSQPIPSKGSTPRAIKKKAPLESEFPLIIHSVVIRRKAFLLSELLVIFSGYWVRKNLTILTALTFPVAQQIILLWDSWASQARPLQAPAGPRSLSWVGLLTHLLLDDIHGCWLSSALYTLSPGKYTWMLHIISVIHTFSLKTSLDVEN